jgi:short-subunit dehydrogenase
MAIPTPTDTSAALVTGASSGIGQALAVSLAQRGHNLVLVARRRDRLDTLATELRHRYGHRVEVLPADLADSDSRRSLLAGLDALDMDIEVAAFSAGFGMGGPFADHDADRVVQMVRTNLEATMVLTHSVLQGMLTRGRGALLLVSSMAGNQPMPNFGAYAATKAGVTSFAEMLSGEVSDQGITVTALCPGGVRTEFSSVGGLEQAERSMPNALMIDADECARLGLAGLDAGKRTVTPRRAVRALTFFGTHAPRALWLPICRKMMST